MVCQHGSGWERRLWLKWQLQLKRWLTLDGDAAAETDDDDDDMMTVVAFDKAAAASVVVALVVAQQPLRVERDHQQFSGDYRKEARLVLWTLCYERGKVW